MEGEKADGELEVEFVVEVEEGALKGKEVLVPRVER